MPGESRSSPREIANYLGRISGPLLDRIDLHIEVPPVKFREISSERTGETSAQIRERVVAARRIQQQRFASKPRITCNARMGSKELKAYCALDEATLELLKMAMNDMNLSARALNLAFMFLGEYPEKVPPAWLIDPKLFASEYDIKRFPDVAPALGLDMDDLAGGSIIEDFDGDGFLDIMVSSWAVRGQLRLFHNNGNGTFTERTAEAGLLGEVGGLNILQTDYNNDGHLDVLVLRGAWWEDAGRFPNSLLRNNGDGTFTDITEEAGLLSFHPTQTAVWFD